MSTPFTVKFPTALDDADSLGIAANDAAGTLSAQLAAGATSFTMASLADANEFGASGALTIDNEIIYFEGRSGASFPTLVRGREGTTDATHASGAVAEQNITAAYHNALSAAIRAVEAKLGYDASTPPGGGASLISDNAGRSTWRELLASDIPDLSATYQLLDADLTAIAALATTSFGRSLLTVADAPAARAAIGAGTSNFDGAFSSLSGRPTTLSGYGITDAYPLTGNPSGFLTANQTITLSGAVSGSGTTSITTTIADGSIANAKLANSSITIAGSATSLGGTITASAILDSLGSTQGQILYRGASGWVVLGPGTAGQVLQTGGAAANPSWTNASGATSRGCTPKRGSA